MNHKFYRIKHKNLKPSRHIFRNILIFCAAAGIFFGSIMLLWIATLKLPSLDSFEERKVAQSAKIYDRTGEILLYDLNANIKRTVVPFDQISANLKEATLAIEDAQFYTHQGIELKSIIRAVLVNIKAMGYAQGGSTITQQVVKNSLLTTDKTITRKVKEWILAWRLDRKMDKDSILNIYLNESPYGGSVYGVEEASIVFFNKHASEVTLAEAAYIAAIPQAPTYYSPYGNHTDKLKERQELVLREMLQNKFITQAEYDAAAKEKVVFRPQRDTSIKAPHFVFFVKEYLTKKYGEDVIGQGGLKITTTLDYAIQEKAEEIAKKYATENEEKFNAENAAIVVIEPATGHVLAMVGSRDYFDKNIGGSFNVATAHNRQPGSAFKPIVYAAAFNKGYTPDTVLFDLRTQFSTRCEPNDFTSENGCYSPDNYDHAYRGPITLRNALAQSLNIPAVKLLYLTGTANAISLARDLGVQIAGDPNQYGLTLVLGGGEVSLLDMTGAYATFANNGIRNPSTPILKVENARGSVLEEFVPQPVNVLSEQTALQISSILSDNNARTPTFGARSALHFPGRDVAVKTGTTNDYRDAWIIGYTPQIAVGAWAGNNDNSPMEKKVAGMIVAPMWNALMSELLTKLPPESFERPAPENQLVLKPVLRGVWQGNQSSIVAEPNIQPAQFPDQQETVRQEVHSILYWVDKNDPRGPAPANPQQDSQFPYWEYPIRLWAAHNGYADGVSVPTGFNPRSQAVPQLHISSPNDEQTFTIDETIPVRFDASAGFSAITKTEVYINGSIVGTSGETSATLTFVPRNIPNLQQNNELKIVTFDTENNRTEKVIRFNIYSD